MDSWCYMLSLSHFHILWRFQFVKYSGVRLAVWIYVYKTWFTIIGATTIETGGDWSPNFLGGGSANKSIVILISIVVTRMQDLASEFSKIFQRWYPRTQHPARPLAERGVQAPRCWNPNLGPLNFSALVVPMFTIFYCTVLHNRLLPVIFTKLIIVY